MDGGKKMISPEEALKEEPGKRSSVPTWYAHMQPEYREKLMKHIAERAAATKPMLFSGQVKLPAPASSSIKRSEIPAGKSCLGMMMEAQQYAEIQSVLLHIQDKLAKKKSRKMDKETLRLLKDMSNMLDDQAGGHDDDTEDATNNEGTKVGSDKEAKKTAVEVEMAAEAEAFASYRRLWEYKRGKTCGSFEEPTVLSSLQFTHYTPGRMPYSGDCYTPETLQIISIKLTPLAAGGLELPLSVYGVVAVRDTVDRNRNILFFRDSRQAQELKQEDPFLHLIGPSRAIVFTDKARIEVELRVKAAGSQDKALMSLARCYTGWNGPGVSTICFDNVLCKLELCLQPVKQTVQATILGVQVAQHDGSSWPFKHGGLVACTPLSGSTRITDGRMSRKTDPSSSCPIVLIESKHEALPKGESGYLHLWRQVVSVGGEGRLDVVIKSYSRTGAVAAETRVRFYPKVSNLSQEKCALGDAEIMVTVAWSLVAASKTGLSLELSGRRFV